jgi:formate--tetrahydrofolate ligase
MNESNLSISQKIKLKKIEKIANNIGLSYEDIEPFGHHKAKIPLSFIDEKKLAQNKLILVTAMSPTPKGEGKTTISVGLSEAMNAIGKKTILALREPSLGPVFGVKGGATGGGYSQVLPMEDINLHFTGDFSAIEKANNLLAAVIDNYIQVSQTDQNIEPRIIPTSVVWKRVLDGNDRFLRRMVVGIGGKSFGIPSETGFNITAASEIMAILCLCENISELKERIGNIYIGDSYSGKPVYARDLEVAGAMTLLLKDAIKPNLVQTGEGNAALIHGGPFANIAHGCSSIIATKMAMSLGDYTITEAGFGADLGAEKFINIKCKYGNIQPHTIVMVATLRAIKYHGEEAEGEISKIKLGFKNLAKHLENTQKYSVPVVVAINKFNGDNVEELEYIKKLCEEIKVKAHICDVWWQGSKGALELAQEVTTLVENTASLQKTYDWSLCIEDKIKKVTKEVYGASEVVFTPVARLKLKKITQLNLDHLPICMAKNPSSFSDDPKARNVPKDFKITVRDFDISAGAGYIVPLVGKILRMPGLPKNPAALGMDINEDGQVFGLN